MGYEPTKKVKRNETSEKQGMGGVDSMTNKLLQKYKHAALDFQSSGLVLDQ